MQQQTKDNTIAIIFGIIGVAITIYIGYLVLYDVSVGFNKNCDKLYDNNSWFTIQVMNDSYCGIKWYMIGEDNGCIVCIKNETNPKFIYPYYARNGSLITR